MDYILVIYYDVFPLLLFIMIGYLLDKYFSLDIRTYNIISSYVAIPLFTFLCLYRYTPIKEIRSTFLFIFILFITSLLGYFIKKAFPSYEISISSFLASDMEALGIVFIFFVFTHAPYITINTSISNCSQTALSIAILMLIAVTLIRISINTFIHTKSIFLVIKKIMATPVLYAALFAFILHYFSIPITHTFLWTVLLHYDGVFIVLIGITAGVWIHRLPKKTISYYEILFPILRFVLMLSIAYLCIRNTHFLSALESQILFIAVSIPATQSMSKWDKSLSSSSNENSQLLLAELAVYLFLCPLAIHWAMKLFPLSLS